MCFRSFPRTENRLWGTVARVVAARASGTLLSLHSGGRVKLCGFPCVIASLALAVTCTTLFPRGAERRRGKCSLVCPCAESFFNVISVSVASVKSRGIQLYPRSWCTREASEFGQVIYCCSSHVQDFFSTSLSDPSPSLHRSKKHTNQIWRGEETNNFLHPNP